MGLIILKDFVFGEDCILGLNGERVIVTALQKLQKEGTPQEIKEATQVLRLLGKGGK